MLQLEPSSYLLRAASITTPTTTTSSHRRQRQSRQQARALLQVYMACNTLHDHHGSALGSVHHPMYWRDAPWERFYYGPQSWGKGRHRQPKANHNRSGQPCRFCPACGLVHSDNRLTVCRDPACGAQLTPPSTLPPRQNGQQGTPPVPPPPTTGQNRRGAPRGPGTLSKGSTTVRTLQSKA